MRGFKILPIPQDAPISFLRNPFPLTFSLRLWRILRSGSLSEFVAILFDTVRIGIGRAFFPDDSALTYSFFS